jgi:outer membrane lipoprotein carrier protein
MLKDHSATDANEATIELIPNVIKNFTKAVLVVDKVKKQVKSFILYDKNGNIFTYKITKYQTDIPVTAADFTFDKSKVPGVEVIDMR